MDKVLKPEFARQLIQDRRKDGYFIDAFKILSDRPDIIAYGLGQGEVNLYRNPDWKVKNISKYTGPVAMDHGDINRNGLTDMVICYQYGVTMVMCDPEGGKIDWLENPGKIDGEWKRRYIGRSTAMHRLRLGYFTQLEKLQVLALPITNRPNDVHSTISVKLFTQPDNLQTAQQWNQKIIDLTNFHVIHEMTVGKFNKIFNIDSQSDLDSAILASEEGINWIYFNPDMQRWVIMPIGIGQTSQAPKTGFKGCGNVATGKVGTDQCAYIATIQPFHGNKVALYYKNKNTSSNGWKWKWERIVLDVFDNPNVLGEGPGHHVICADFDGDGDDEFLVALRGPSPWKGVYYYKVLDLEKKIINKWKISEDSAARIVVNDFDGDGRMDFATIGYSVAGYYQDQNPSIVLYRNQFAPLSKNGMSNKMEMNQMAQKTKILDFSKTIQATWINYSPKICIGKRSIVINLNGSQHAIIRAEFQKKLMPRQSAIVENVDILNIHSMLIFEIQDNFDCQLAAQKGGWKKLSEIDPSFTSSIPLYKSKQYDLGVVQFDPTYAVGQTEKADKDLFKKYLLKVNLWYCPPMTDCQLHKVHEKPLDFLEVHTQIYGLGRMQKFHKNDKSSIYYEKMMSQGETHQPFAGLENGKFIYPWHQYYADNACIWIANEYHVI